jgi:xylulokinase
LTLANTTAANVARAAIEGVLCGLADGVDALIAQGVEVARVVLTGGGSRSDAVRRIAPTVFGRPVCVPATEELAACGAARQAAWALLGSPTPPPWPVTMKAVDEAPMIASVRDQYVAVRDGTA